MPARSRAATIAVGAGAVLGLGVAAWAALSVLVARVIITPVRRFRDDVPILAADSGTVTLGADAETTVPGRYGLWLAQRTGYARIGRILATGPGTVTREVEEVVAGSLDEARSGRWTGWYYLTPDDLGLEHEDVEIPTRFGAQPAWFVPAERPTGRWTVLVHGRGVTRSECLRAVPTLRDAGWNCLVVSYRNDPDSPASGDRRYALGEREWEDVEAALGWAIDRGAETFVLAGWSMGGATALQTAHRSRSRDRIRGILLDSPVVDWHAVIAEQARVLRLPDGVRQNAVGMLGRSWSMPLTGLAEPLDLARLDWVARADELDHPVLLLHSRADRTVPFAPSAELAARRPDLVTLVAFERAQHTRLWNYDTERWTEAVRDWLSRLT